MLTLNHFLKAGGIDPSVPIKLLRHTPREAPANEAWRAGWLHEYERMHDSNFRAPDYFVTFIPFANAVRFLWVKRVVAPAQRHALAANPDYPFPDHYATPGVAFDLERVPAFDAHEGRAIFSWGSGTRGYDVWHKPAQPLSLIELIAPNALSGFKGYGQVFLSIHDLRDLTKREDANLDWRAALRAVSGVYLISDLSDGALYVGSASGIDGFLGRFSDYARTGHGGNALLRKRLSEAPQALNAWRWSILDTLPIATSRIEVLTQEQFQKMRLGSRAHGLNGN